MIIKWYYRLSIARKIRAILMLGGLFSIICFGGIYIYYGVYALAKGHRESTLQTVALLANRSVAAIRFGVPGPAEQYLKSISEDATYRTICIYTAEGQVFASYQAQSDDKRLDCPALKPRFDGFFAESALNTSKFLSVTRNIRADGQVIGAIHAIRDKTAIANFLSDQLEAMLVIALVCLTLGYIVAGYLQRLISTPIIDMANGARQLATQNHGSLHSKRQDELGQLAESFNNIFNMMGTRLTAVDKSRATYETALDANLTAMQRLIRDYSTAAGSFLVYSDLTARKICGPLVDGYVDYQADVIESLSTHNVKLDGFMRLSGIYRDSIQTPKVEINLAAFVRTFCSQLKQSIPFLQIVNSISEQKAPALSVHKKAWEEVFFIMHNLLYSISGIIEFTPTIEVGYDDESYELQIVLCDKNFSQSISPSEQRHLDSLEEMIRGVDRADIRSTVAVDSLYEKNSIEDPYAAEEFINEDILQREHIKYIIESISYIANANMIDVNHSFETHRFTLLLSLQKNIQSSTNQIREALIQ